MERMIVQAMSEDHSADVFFGCGYCNQVFQLRTALEVHTKLQHEGAEVRCVPSPPPKDAHGHKGTSLISLGIPLSEVARHNTHEDCWVAMNGEVFDLTEFLDRHPGGWKSIMNWAGKDASVIFNSIHQQAWLAQYLRPQARIGKLGIDSDLMTDSYWHKLREARIEEIKEELRGLLEVKPVQSDVKVLLGTMAKKEPEPPAKLRKDSSSTPCFGCVHCSQVFESPAALAVHVERMHPGTPCEFRPAEAPRPLSETLGEALRKLAPNSTIPLSEVAKHNTPQDCWVAVNGKVYDLGPFLATHPHEGRNPILAVAGSDASNMWNKIPGRFPSQAWFEEFMKPEFIVGNVGPEPQVDAKEALIQELQAELKRLEGPPEGSGFAGPSIPLEALKQSEELRFPKLKEVQKPANLPLYTRAQVAEHKDRSSPWIILHNKVYDMTKLLGNHPGGDDILLGKAGTDATADFEVFDHSEKSRVRREQDLLIGELVPEDRREWAVAASAVEAGVAGAGPGLVAAPTFKSMLALYAKGKVVDAVLLATVAYLYMAIKNRKPLSSFTYSRALRHMHLLMGIGLFGTIGTAQAASRAQGLDKKRYLRLHKQTGLLMFFALFVRIFLRMRSGIPPRFPGNKVVQLVETQSLRAFYGLCFVLPLTGITFDYFLYWAKGNDERNERIAKVAIDAHKVLGKFFEYVWLPFHLGYTGAYHYSNGRPVFKKVSPFV